MDSNKEYHDPDYPEASVSVKEEPPKLSDDEKLDKIKSIVRRELSNELKARENDVMVIDQRMSKSRRLLHRLRYSIVSRYYQQQQLQLSAAEVRAEIDEQREPRARAETSALLRESQRAIHPSVRKLLGKQTVDMEEIFRSRAPRNKTRKDYSAMVKYRNYTIPADSTKTLRPEGSESPLPKKQPQHFQPKITNVISLSDPTRNQMKHRYRFVIGNTSKYVPSSSRLDKSTHKWLVYIRAVSGRETSVPACVTSAVVTLHHSYAPHHIVTLHEPPFQVSRRGWGEFPAKIELHFPLPELNRPVVIEHTIKLDRNYTGMQMLGSETVVDVWLYSTPEMLPHVYEETNTQTLTHNHTHTDTHTNTDSSHTDSHTSEKVSHTSNSVEKETHTDAEPQIKQEIDDWMDFFKSPSELDVDEMIIRPNKERKEQIKDDVQEKADISVDELPSDLLKPTAPKKRIVKYIDPTTGKIFYLEMDRQLDLTKVQEIIINNTKAKIAPLQNGVQKKKKNQSLLKPELKNLAEKKDIFKNFPHIENDHCYLATPKESPSVANVKQETSLYEYLCSVMYRFNETRQAVNFLFKKIPVISCEARDPDFAKHFPFVVENSQKYWKLDFAKRRNIEWSRAKLINNILREHFSGPKWRTKQILLYSRLHGYHPIRDTEIMGLDDNTWAGETIKDAYPNAQDICSLTKFGVDLDSSLAEVTELSDEEDVEILNDPVRREVKREYLPEAGSLTVLPVENAETRLRYMYVERKCADIGIELKCENVGNGYSYSAVHAVILSAMKSFAEEIIRSSLAVKRRQDDPRDTPSVWAGGSGVSAVSGAHAWAAAAHGRLALLAARGLARTHTHTAPL